MQYNMYVMGKYRIMCEPLDQLLFFIWISCSNGRHVNCRLGMLYLVEKKTEKLCIFPEFSILGIWFY